MKHVVYKDKRGYVRRVLLRDKDPDEQADKGIPAGPPDFSVLDWETIVREMQNAMAENGLFDNQTMNASGMGVSPAITILKRYLIGLYRYDGGKNGS